MQQVQKWKTGKRVSKKCRIECEYQKKTRERTKRGNI